MESLIYQLDKQREMPIKEFKFGISGRISGSKAEINQEDRERTTSKV